MKKQTKLGLGLSLIVTATVILVFSYGRTHAEVSRDVRTTYDAKCAKCHGKDGRAKSLHAKQLHARDLTDAAWQNDVSDERLFNSISNGRNKMPSFKKQLSESEIDALVAYVRRFKK